MSGSPRRLVVEADGGSRGNPGPAAYGAVVRDAQTGDVLAEVAERIGTATNNVAEYRGLIAGLRAVARLDPAAQVEVRLDSKLVVEQMSGRWKIKHPDLQPLAGEAARVLPGGQVRYRWVPREQNRHADRLLNEVLDRAPGDRPGAGTAGGTPTGGAAPRAVPAVALVDEEEPRRPPNRLLAWSADLGPATSLLMMRHGETPLTIAKRFSGGDGAGPGLAPEGRAHAERAAAGLLARGVDIAAVVTSPLRRARETAGIVAAALGLTARTEPGFREAHFGAWDGLTFAEVSARWPQELQAWLASTSVAPPGGESYDALAGRVAAARDRVVARHPRRTVVVVSHVTPIKTLVRLALGAPPDALWRMELSPCSTTQIDYWGDGSAALRAFSVPA